ncbi:WxcM-like domain-containing protein [Luteimonas sp. SDU101]|uniref:WxcM-like domain-containing protein n=1 Tax=Luteimonas sp. SDU101 TaxID=3422593 RepID=UPI003EBF4F5D
MNHFVHEKAICETGRVGPGTKIWAFAHVLPGAEIGRDCNICDGVFIENDVVVGDRVTVKCGVQLWDGVRLGDDVFVGPNATFTNDRFPRSRQYPDAFEQTIIEAGASIGANATLLPGIRIGRGAMVGAGSVVTRSVPSNAIVAGNPARIVGYVGDSRNNKPKLFKPPADCDAKYVATGVAGVQLHRIPAFKDIRGSLAAGEFSSDLPFTPQRYFLVFDVPSSETRGEHAHRHCDQFLVCVHGSVRALVDDGHRREEHLLDSAGIGLFQPAMTWGTQYRYSRDAVLLVFASHGYDPDDYIRSYDQFLEIKLA